MRLPAVLGVMAGALVACGSDSQLVQDEATAPVPPTAAATPTTGSPQPIDPLAYEIIRLVEDHEFGILDRYVEYEEVRCTGASDVEQGGLRCRVGEGIGTPVHVFRVPGGPCQAHFVRPGDDVDGPITSWFLPEKAGVVLRFFAVFEGGNPYGSPRSTADYSVGFAYDNPGAADQRTFGFWFELTGGRITALVNACGGFENQWGADPPVMLEPATRAPQPALLPPRQRALVDEIVRAQRAANWDALEALVGFTMQPCVPDPEPDVFDPATCRAGEPAGTLVDAFFYSHCHAAFWRAGDRERFLDVTGGIVRQDARLYGVFPAVPRNPTAADYVVVFMYEHVSDPDTGFWLSVKDGRIVAQSHSCGTVMGEFNGPALYMVPPE